MKLGILLIVPRHRLGVQAVVLNQANKVLLLEHVFHPYAPWGLPGGWMNRHEDPRRAVIRELYEETGLLGEVGPPLHVERVPQPHQLTMAFLVRADKQELVLSGEILTARWYDIADLPQGMYGFNYDAILAAQRLLQGEPEFEQIELR